ALRRVERIAVMRADGGDAKAAQVRLAGETLRFAAPVHFLRRGEAGFKTVPLKGTEAVLPRPVERFEVCVREEADAHGGGIGILFRSAGKEKRSSKLRKVPSSKFQNPKKLHCRPIAGRN